MIFELFWICGSQLPQLRSTEMITCYAKKSLSIPKSATSDQKPHTHNSVAELEQQVGTGVPESAASNATEEQHNWKPKHKSLWCLTGNDSNDADIRKQHAYETAPCVELTRGLLDLCGDSDEAGQVID